MWEDIGDAIYNVLTGMTVFDAVYNYEPNELKKYPCATVSGLSHTNEFANTAQNRREFQYMVRLYYRRDMADYEGIMRKVVDSIITYFETNPTIDGVCDWAYPTESKWLFTEREVPLRVCEVTINAVKLFNR